MVLPEGLPAEMAALHAAGFKLVHYDAAPHSTTYFTAVLNTQQQTSRTAVQTRAL